MSAACMYTAQGEMLCRANGQENQNQGTRESFFGTGVKPGNVCVAGRDKDCLKLSKFKSAKCIPDGNNVYRCAHPLRVNESCKPADLRYLCGPGLACTPDKRRGYQGYSKCLKK